MQPDIIVFHEVISDYEIEYIKNLAKPRVSNLFYLLLMHISKYKQISVTSFMYNIKIDKHIFSSKKKQKRKRTTQ